MAPLDEFENIPYNSVHAYLVRHVRKMHSLEVRLNELKRQLLTTPEENITRRQKLGEKAMHVEQQFIALKEEISSYDQRNIAPIMKQRI